MTVIGEVRLSLRLRLRLQLLSLIREVAVKLTMACPEQGTGTGPWLRQALAASLT